RAGEGSHRVWDCGFGPQSTKGGEHPPHRFPNKSTEQKKLDGKYDIFPPNFLFFSFICFFH
ncbi:hypothetical protein, partial [Aneurinibacillus aneurinilyticus]|uniref:hypothetical protein n=1 Tax=Aneurinibacillus aneurinilyticus TaxID=1391 RepID=UPI0023F6F845